MAIGRPAFALERSGRALPPARRTPALAITQGRYELRFARSALELDAALRLRFEVFNLELGEGLRRSLLTGRDEDEFDAVCDHLIVADRSDGRIVGTYRMQTAEMAQAALGFYSGREFDLDELPPAVRSRAVELGRACIARSHRNTRVLSLLWRGIAAYLRHEGMRFLFGCCSLTSQEPREGHALLQHLAARGGLHPTLRLRARPEYLCLSSVASGAEQATVAVPRLFDMYLAMGAQVCSAPAIDREFRTIDFLVLFDVERLDERGRRRFLPAERQA